MAGWILPSHTHTHTHTHTHALTYTPSIPRLGFMS